MTKDLNTALLFGFIKNKPFHRQVFFLLHGRRRNGGPTLLDMAERDLSCEEFSKH